MKTNSQLISMNLKKFCASSFRSAVTSVAHQHSNKSHLTALLYVLHQCYHGNVLVSMMAQSWRHVGWGWTFLFCHCCPSRTCMCKHAHTCTQPNLSCRRASVDGRLDDRAAPVHSRQFLFTGILFLSGCDAEFQHPKWKRNVHKKMALNVSMSRVLQTPWR